jgi:hypothetical protein
VIAFFLDAYYPYTRRGSYTLTIEETGAQAVGEHATNADLDMIIANEQIKFFNKPESGATHAVELPARAGGESPREPRANGDDKSVPK